MKFRVLLPAAVALLFTGCGFVGKTLGTATNLVGSVINTVTAPLNLADQPDAKTEKAWRERTAALNREDAAKNDRRRTPEKRRR